MCCFNKIINFNEHIMSNEETLNENIYTLVTDDSGEERSCANIPDEACEDVPTGFVRNALSGVCSKLAEQLASPGLILPWLLSAAGASSFFAGALVPIKDAGSLLPQLAVSGRIRKIKKRKKPWTYAAIIRCTWRHFRNLLCKRYAWDTLHHFIDKFFLSVGLKRSLKRRKNHLTIDVIFAPTNGT